MPNMIELVVNFNEALPKINVEVFDSLLNVEVPENLQEKSTAELNSSIFSSALGLGYKKIRCIWLL